MAWDFFVICSSNIRPVCRNAFLIPASANQTSKTWRNIPLETLEQSLAEGAAPEEGSFEEPAACASLGFNEPLESSVI
ncbi:MAG: hypothetical protein SX243_13610 [Acidobacteriota bacterium]|nr:hypothetical protein [Acidobacteriota bacterium]